MHTSPNNTPNLIYGIELHSIVGIYALTEKRMYKQASSIPMRKHYNGLVASYVHKAQEGLSQQLNHRASSHPTQ